MVTKTLSNVVAGGFLALVLLAVRVRPAGGVAPPRPSGKLTAEQQKRLDKLNRELHSAAFAGKMGEALRLAREGEALRRHWQGSGHWQAVDARFEVERWQRLALLSAADQKLAGRAVRRRIEAGVLLGRGRFAEAERAAHEALTIFKKVLGEQHPETAAGYDKLAACLSAQGRHAQGQPLYEKALAIRKKVLGEQHPDTAYSYNNLAFCFHAQGKPAQALLLCQEALAIKKKVLGEQHPETATSYNNVAGCLHAQGRYAQALPLYERALAISKKVLGEQHADTGTTYNNVAACLIRQGKFGQALPPFKRGLAICKKVLGEQHRDTATCYNNVAFCVQAQGKYAHALPLFERALAIRTKVLGEMNPDTAQSYNNVAICLHAQGKHGQELPLLEMALAICKKMLGEGHPDTARSYNNIAACLSAQGRHAQALPLFERALAISKKVPGEQHAHTATCYNNVAACLDAQGKHAQALRLHEKALAIYMVALGEQHSDTARCYNNVAACLNEQGRHAQALPLCEKALDLRRELLGEKHPDTARSYNNVAACLSAQGKYVQALPLHERALAISKKVLGEDHPSTARNYNSEAGCLHAQGRYARAELLYERGLAIRRKMLGEEHPETAQSYNGLALCLYARGKHREAIRHWQAALLGYDAGRLGRAASGFDRALAGANFLLPRDGLALAHARLGEPALAWQHAEAGLARNLLDDRAAAAPEDASSLSHLRRLDDRLLPLFGLERPSEDQRRLRDELTRQRRAVLARLSQQAATRSAELVWPLQRIQEQWPSDAALVLWLGLPGENWACVLRAQGPPRWQRLTGTGVKGAWKTDDYSQPDRLRRALADAGSSAARRRDLINAVSRRWFAPLRPLLAADGKLPGVKHVFVVPSRFMAALPVAVIAPEYVVSYTPSATLLAQALAGHRPLKADAALALGDPVFLPAALRPAPKTGVLVAQVLAGGNADRAGLRAGDVLVRFDDVKLETINDLAGALKKNGRGQAVYWREGQEHRVALAGPLGVRVDRRPAPAAVRAWREENAPQTRGETYEPLPGTRAEVLALQRLLGKSCQALLGSGASEQALDQLAQKGELKRFHLVHLATHATIDLDQPERSAVILARDRLPGLAESAERAARGLRPYTGELTVDAILRGWQLDADLVVLSACRTGLGRQSSGEGLLGFSYALMRAGARSVVLSLWKVDDTATALFMLRFYENLLGKRKEMKKPLGKAESLAEAANWLRGLSRKEAEQLAGALGQGKLTGTARGSVGELKLKEGEVKLPSGGRPYAHPYYWAAFTLLGDPD
jgi:CHAT domain-containing protein/Tfp pilus assembly protein PilF